MVLSTMEVMNQGRVNPMLLAVLFLLWFFRSFSQKAKSATLSKHAMLDFAAMIRARFPGGTGYTSGYNTGYTTPWPDEIMCLLLEKDIKMTGNHSISISKYSVTMCNTTRNLVKPSRS